MSEKEVKVRLPPQETLKKLDDLIRIEIESTINYIRKATEVKKELLSKIKDPEYRTNLSTAYDQKFSEILYHKHINNILEYVSLLAYAESLNDNGVLYAFETNWGDLRITYKPYILKINQE